MCEKESGLENLLKNGGKINLGLNKKKPYLLFFFFLFLTYFQEYQIWLTVLSRIVIPFAAVDRLCMSIAVLLNEALGCG